MNAPTKYFRKGRTIRGPEGDQTYPSINQAKRASRKLQAANGGQGRGSLRVVDKLPDPAPEAA